MIGKTLRAHT